jgi:hypothetical protein
VAFRYEIPQSAPLMDVLIEDEITEFRFPSGARAGGELLRSIPSETRLDPPLVVEAPGAAWVSVAEAGALQSMHLRHYDADTLVVRLPQFGPEPKLAVRAKSPWTSPWRLLTVGPARESVERAALAEQIGAP